MLNHSKYCFLITNSEAGCPNARLVQPIPSPDDFVVWIGTHPKLRKIREIKANPNVTLAFGDMRKDANLILHGEANIRTESDLKHQYWKGAWRLFFPDGPKSDDYVLICIKSYRIELMNFHRNIVPEPFGLRPVVLIKKDNQWVIREVGGGR